MKIRKDVSAAGLNTFGISANIKTLVEIEEKSDLNDIDAFTRSGFRILGGGSNILIRNDLNLPVLKICNKGIRIEEETEEYAILRIAAGENWHSTVMFAIDNNLGGIENLALIPGNSGTAPMQNIGAYGVEIREVFFALNAYRIADGHEYTFHRDECRFGYRDSIFKNRLRDQFIITEIFLRLTKPGHHIINTSYGQISNKLEERGIDSPTIRDVADVVISIRTDKLPDPGNIGNAGSFFKNPVVDRTIFENIRNIDADVPSYPAGDNEVKIPAAWLIDRCGWKGKKVGQTGTYKNQALVLVNHGGATGQEIYNLSEAIRDSVLQKFGVELEREVNLW